MAAGKKRDAGDLRQLVLPGIIALTALVWWTLDPRSLGLERSQRPAQAAEREVPSDMAGATRRHLSASVEEAEPALDERQGAPVVASDAACDDDDPTNCPRWALNGECGNNPVYMKLNCARSCNSCSYKQAASCSSDGPNAVQNGDISRTFQRAAGLTQYQPTVLSRDPWVLVYDAFLTPEEAAELIRVGGHNFTRSLAGDGVTPIRTSSTSWCNIPSCEHKSIIRTVKARALGILEIPEENSEHLQTLRWLAAFPPRWMARTQWALTVLAARHAGTSLGSFTESTTIRTLPSTRPGDPGCTPSSSISMMWRPVEAPGFRSSTSP